jgi:tight adherence protein C
MVQAMYLGTILLCLVGLFLLRIEKKRQLKHRISSVLLVDVVEEKSIDKEELKKVSFSNRVIRPLMTQLKLLLKRRLTNEKKEKMDSKLLQAGSPMGMTAVEFRIAQLVILIVIPLLFAGYGLLLNFSLGGIVLCLLFGLAFAMYLPGYYLKVKTRSRGRRAIKELPDFLDLLTVSIEAGLGFDSALSKVVSKKDGVLSQEFQRCLEEMRLGKSRREALSGIRERVVSEDVKTLIASIIQAEQLGIGMVQILSVQSEEVRARRKQRAEEQAMKAPIKMLFPLVLFIFPCIFIILLGPAVIGFLETF